MMSPIYATDTDEGAVSRTAVLFIHGDFSNGKGTWSKQLTKDIDARKIVIDRRGHGDSPPGSPPFTVRTDALDAIELLKKRQVDKVHVAGHSYGGLIAIELASLAPEMVESLHLIEPSYMKLLPDDPDVNLFDRQVRDLIAESQSMTLDEFTSGFFALLMDPQSAEKLQSKPVWPSLVAESSRYAIQQYAGDFDPERLDVMLERRMDTKGNPSYPVIIYAGGRSHIGLQKVANELARRIEGSRWEFVPEAGHSVQHSGTHFNDVLKEYVNGS